MVAGRGIRANTYGSRSSRAMCSASCRAVRGSRTRYTWSVQDLSAKYSTRLKVVPRVAEGQAVAEMAIETDTKCTVRCSSLTHNCATNRECASCDEEFPLLSVYVHCKS